MIGLGTIINAAGIIGGGLIGLVLGKKISKRFGDILVQAAGICVLFLGIGGAMEYMLTVKDGSLSLGGGMMLIICFSLGALIGEWINLEKHMETFGEWLKHKSKSEKDTKFIDGFVTASLTVCIGAMAIMGAIKDGIFGDYSILAAKTVLDFIIILVMASSMGKGCIFSAIPVAIFQGTITLLARFIEPVMTKAALANLSLTGSVLIFCIGVNLVWDKKIKVANLLPAVFLSLVYAFLFEHFH